MTPAEWARAMDERCPHHPKAPPTSAAPWYWAKRDCRICLAEGFRRAMEDARKERTTR